MAKTSPSLSSARGPLRLEVLFPLTRNCNCIIVDQTWGCISPKVYGFSRPEIRKISEEVLAWIGKGNG